MVKIPHWHRLDHNIAYKNRLRTLKATQLLFLKDAKLASEPLQQLGKSLLDHLILRHKKPWLWIAFHSLSRYWLHQLGSNVQSKVSWLQVQKQNQNPAPSRIQLARLHHQPQQRSKHYTQNHNKRVEKNADVITALQLPSEKEWKRMLNSNPDVITDLQLPSLNYKANITSLGTEDFRHFSLPYII